MIDLFFLFLLVRWWTVAVLNFFFNSSNSLIASLRTVVWGEQRAYSSTTCFSRIGSSGIVWGEHVVQNWFWEHVETYCCSELVLRNGGMKHLLLQVGKFIFMKILLVVPKIVSGAKIFDEWGQTWSVAYIMVCWNQIFYRRNIVCWLISNSYTTKLKSWEVTSILVFI